MRADRASRHSTFIIGLAASLFGVGTFVTWLISLSGPWRVRHQRVFVTTINAGLPVLLILRGTSPVRAGVSQMPAFRVEQTDELLVRQSGQAQTAVVVAR